eukprot:CAMPEP_0194292964 /NCGR_PEP_ID=MMETSP0169-20130528/46835_1 /TAXON_ID=218684 /ORGANISM="Corethron pennatum, Strain L29A3" /LENGTH=129 /DNA_ID=CAMNT_0039041309 /DNA_START=40 /DNA_END=425 /DNA_ORIENTATION=-
MSHASAPSGSLGNVGTLHPCHAPVFPPSHVSCCAFARVVSSASPPSLVCGGGCSLRLWGTCASTGALYLQAAYAISGNVASVHRLRGPPDGTDALLLSFHPPAAHCLSVCGVSPAGTLEAHCIVDLRPL